MAWSEKVDCSIFSETMRVREGDIERTKNNQKEKRLRETSSAEDFLDGDGEGFTEI